MKRILVADDEKEIVNSLQEMLAPFYQVDTTISGLEVLLLCSRFPYDGVILDKEFRHGQSGLETAEQLRISDKKIKIIIFSALDLSADERKQILSIEADFIEKPLSLISVKQAFGE